MNATLTYDGCQATFYNCDPQDCIEGELLRGQWYDLELLEFVRGLGIEGNYLDVGAYVGTFSLFAAMFCPARKVYSIEPQNDIYRKLYANLTGNGVKNFDAFPIAVSDVVRFGAMVTNQGNRGGAKLTGDSGAVGVMPLDNLKLTDVRLVKIDVESSELSVLRGGIKTIAGADHLFIEVWPEETCDRYGVPYTGQEVADLLHQLGFLHQRELAGDNHYWRKA